jgi:hypothetical protein
MTFGLKNLYITAVDDRTEKNPKPKPKPEPTTVRLLLFA